MATIVSWWNAVDIDAVIMISSSCCVHATRSQIRNIRLRFTSMRSELLTLLYQSAWCFYTRYWDITCLPTLNLSTYCFDIVRTNSSVYSIIDVLNHRCKNVFNVFFIFQTFFYLKNVGKVQSGKQINKKHFQNNSNETDLWFFCCMWNDLKCLPINFYLLT